MYNSRKYLAAFVSLMFLFSSHALAAEGVSEELSKSIDIVWVLLAAFLVFFMQAGFGALEAGLIRAKNSTNVLMKNFMDFCIASLGFWAIGYGIMYGAGNGFMGLSGFFLSGLEKEAGNLPLTVFWLFQVVFCGTAATIVSGVMAERMKFHAYLIYSLILSVIVYPVVGHWVWGGGWLSNLGFKDFAGSGVVHSLGGFAGLVGTILLGPRIGKYGPDGKPRMLAGHNIPLAALGTLILWFGWYGFNPGSTLGITGENGILAGSVAINTTLAAAAGGVGAMITIWALIGKPDITMTMNGILAGLVGITAPCAYISDLWSVIVGAIAGILVVLGVLTLDRLRIDDPVGAWSVHGLNGAWGVIAVGLFDKEAGLITTGSAKLLGIQILGEAAIIVWTVITMFIIFYATKATIGLRVEKEEELRGLDIGEHGVESYAGFDIFLTT